MICEKNKFWRHRAVSSKNLFQLRNSSPSHLIFFLCRSEREKNAVNLYHKKFFFFSFKKTFMHGELSFSKDKKKRISSVGGKEFFYFLVCFSFIKKWTLSATTMEKFVYIYLIQSREILITFLFAIFSISQLLSV